jgi:ABC-type oligopeptide transport system ATPase subunit
MSKGGLVNFYTLKEVKEMREDSHNPHSDETQIDIPSRNCVVGASGSGKSTCLLNFILKTPNTWGWITIVTKQQEPLYDYLEKKLKGKNITIHYSLDKLEEPKDFPNKELQNLLIFDDMIAEKNQRKIVDYFIRGRKIGAGITCFYLSQSYYQVPKTIRAQLSYIWLVKIGQKRDLNLILADSGGLVDKATLMQLYTDATREKFHFLKINLNTVDMNRKFSKNFTDFYLLDGKSEEQKEKK